MTRRPAPPIAIPIRTPVPYNTPDQSRAMALLSCEYPERGWNMEQLGWAGIPEAWRKEAARLFTELNGPFRDWKPQPPRENP